MFVTQRVGVTVPKKWPHSVLLHAHCLARLEYIILSNSFYLLRLLGFVYDSCTWITLSVVMKHSFVLKVFFFLSKGSGSVYR